MTDSFDVEGGSIDFGEFEDWLDHVAETEGTSRRSVLNDLVSTYWVLNELTEEVDPDIGRRAEQEADDDDPARTDLVEALRAVGELFHQRENTSGRTVDPDLLRLLESAQGSGDRRSTDHGYDLIRLEHQLSRTDDRLSEVASEIDTVRSELSVLSSRIDEVDDWDPSEIERRQDAVEELVRERVDWLEEKVDALYLELLDAIDEHQDEIGDLSETVETIDARTGELTDVVEREGRKRRSELQRLRDGFEAEMVSAREETDDRLETMRSSFQNAIDEIEEHLYRLYDRDGETERRMDEIMELLESRLGPLFEREAERAALTQLLREAQELGIQSAACRSCERPVDLDMLTRPVCPHCERVFGGIETERGLLRKRHELTTRIPGYEFDVPPLKEAQDAEEEGLNEEELDNPALELALDPK